MFEKMLLFGLEIASVTFEMFIVHFYLSSFFKHKYIWRWLAPIAYITFGLALVVLPLVHAGMITLLTTTFIGIVSISALLYKGQLHTRFFVALMFCLLAMMSEIFSSAIVDVFANGDLMRVSNYGAARIISATLSNLCLLMIVKIIGSIVKKRGISIKSNLLELAPLLICQVLSIATTIELFLNILSTKKLITMMNALIIFTILFINIIILLHYEKILASNELKRDKEVAKIELENQLRYYDLIQKRQDESISMQHDIQKHIKVMEGLLDDNFDSKAAEYLSTIKNTFAARSTLVYTPNPVITIILSDCISRSHNIGVKPNICIHISDNLVIDAADVTIILGNTIDNAIKALEELPESTERCLNLTMKENGSFLLYEIANHYDPAIRSNESDRQRKGYGLRNIKTCVEKYGGELTITQRDGTYTVTVLLQLKIPHN